MSAAPPKGSHGAGARRVRYAAQAALLALAITACCGFALVIAHRFPVVFDVTSTREHRLSARAERVLGSLPGPYEIVIVVNGAGLDPRAAQRTQDVLESMQRASRNLTVTTLDVSSAAGATDLDRTLTRLVSRYTGDFERHRKALAAVEGAATDMGADLSALSDSLLGASATVSGMDANAATLRAFLDRSAAFCRASMKDIADGVRDAAAQSRGSIGRTPVPAVDEAVRAARKPLAALLAEMPGMAESLGALAGSTATTVPEELRSRARSMLASAGSIRDAASRAVASLDDLPRLPIAAAARTLERQGAAIVIGPPGSPRGGITAVDASALFPARTGTGGPSPDTRARAEETVLSGIDAVSSADTPIVVLVHGEAVRIAPDYAPYLTTWAERLRSRGIDIVEWATALDAEAPSTTMLDPKHLRPVVYVAVPTAAGTRDGAGRMVKLAGKIRGLVEGGASVLVSVNVSELPTTGQADPMVEFLKPLGIEADTARPLLEQTPAPTGRVVSSDILTTDPKAEHAVSGAIRGLSLRLLWPVPLRLSEHAGVVIQPIVTIENRQGSIWAESEWMAFRRVPFDQRSSIANPPAPDSPRDDAKGPWTVAAAVERSVSAGGSPAVPQRVVVVGSNGWFFDEVAQAQTLVYGRPTLFSPANAELFDAGLAWLVRHDTAISVSAQAQVEALIPNLSAGALSAIRWGLIGGLPVLILLVGAVWRLVRG